MQARQQNQARPKPKSLDELAKSIIYSNKYYDDIYEYRHVILPKALLKLIHKSLHDPKGSGTLRLLSELEWRQIGIAQSQGWEHYEVHAPEPHVLLFRRPLALYDPAEAAVREALREPQHYESEHLAEYEMAQYQQEPEKYQGELFPSDLNEAKSKAQAAGPARRVLRRL